MGGQQQTLSERGKKFQELSASFFAQVRTDFLSTMDKDGAIMNLKEFLDKYNKIDISKIDAQSKVIYDKLILAPAKVDRLLNTAHQMLQILAEKDKLHYDQAKLLLAFSAHRLKEFAAKLEKEIPGILDEIGKIK